MHQGEEGAATTAATAATAAAAAAAAMGRRRMGIMAVCPPLVRVYVCAAHTWKIANGCVAGTGV